MQKKTKPISDEELAKEKEARLVERLRLLREKEEEREAAHLAKIYGLPFITLKGFPVDKEAMALIPEEKAKGAKAICFYQRENSIRLGVVDPANPKINQIVQELKNQDFDPHFYLISEPSFASAFQFYKQILRPKKKIEKVEIEKGALSAAQAAITSISDLRKKLRVVSLSEAISIILAGAVLTSASDIHLEPAEKETFLRYRIDGVLQTITEISNDLYARILPRIKFLAGLKINVTDVPQDGRFSIVLKEREIDLRVSSLPTPYGETVVMRLLGVGAMKLDLQILGLRKKEREILEREMQRPNGMILTTGPTSSGKTTTLYALLTCKRSPKIKIITLEDPVEYRLEGIVQTQINPEAGLTFSRGLRAILRQNPDVVMVGEIRDLETAEIACQAAMTGHLVFSTLHTNDAAGVVPRLLILGVRPYIIGPALRTAMAQRLVRRLCPHCKTSYQSGKREIEEIKSELEDFFPKGKVGRLYKSKGCEKCHLTGFAGRIGIFEVFQITQRIEELITSRASAKEIFDEAKRQGMMTMRQDGLLKVIEGITSLEEVKRVT